MLAQYYGLPWLSYRNLVWQGLMQDTPGEQHQQEQQRRWRHAYSWCSIQQNSCACLLTGSWRTLGLSMTWVLLQVMVHV